MAAKGTIGFCRSFNIPVTDIQNAKLCTKYTGKHGHYQKPKKQKQE
jgi:hypothetical protein